MALRFEGTYLLRDFEMMKELSDGKSGDNLLGSEDLI